jgi:hypothetical protein
MTSDIHNLVGHVPGTGLDRTTTFGTYRSLVPNVRTPVANSIQSGTSTVTQIGDLLAACDRNTWSQQSLVPLSPLWLPHGQSQFKLRANRATGGTCRPSCKGGAEGKKHSPSASAPADRGRTSAPIGYGGDSHLS